MKKQELLNFICDIYNIDKCNDMILKQIHKYVTERGYEYIEIARALSYFVDIQGNEPQLKYGIGIVPYIFKEAQDYYKKLKQQKEEQIKAAKENKKIDNSIICCKLKKENKRKRNIDINKL